MIISLVYWNRTFQLRENSLTGGRNGNEEAEFNQSGIESRPCDGRSISKSGNQCQYVEEVD